MVALVHIAEVSSHLHPDQCASLSRSPFTPCMFVPYYLARSTSSARITRIQGHLGVESLQGRRPGWRREMFTICRGPVVDSVFNGCDQRGQTSGSYMGRMANADRASGDCSLLSVNEGLVSMKTSTMQR